MIATLRHRHFWLLWLAGLISRMGDWVMLVGLPIYVYLLTRSVLATSLGFLAGGLPQVLLGSVAGVFVDRWDRKRTMIVTNLLLALALLPLLLVDRVGRVWIVYVVMLVEATIEQFVTPAQSAILPTLVGEERLVTANSLTALSANAARLVGPALGGLVAAALGLMGIVLADAVSFLLAAALLVGIAAPARVRASAGERAAAGQRGAFVRLQQEWVGGLRTICSERTLVVLLGMFAVTSLGEGVFATLYPIFVYQVLRGGALQIGELMSAQAVGGLLGGVLIGWAGKQVMSRRVIAFGQILFGLIDLAIFNSPAYVPAYWLTVGLFVAVGVPGLSSSTGAQALLQATTPEAYLGRVFGVLGTIMGACLLFGTVTAGAFTPQIGVVPMLNIQGAGYVAAGLLVLTLLPSMRRQHEDGPVPEPVPVKEEATNVCPQR
jgi:MFS family permease